MCIRTRSRRASCGPGEDVPDVEKISSDDDAVRRLIARVGSPRRLRACYEAGPTGYELARLLKARWGWRVR